MDGAAGSAHTVLMPRYRCHVYRDDGAVRYLVLWTLQWEVIQCRILAPGTDRRAALQALLGAEALKGWQAEGTADFGFVFLRRGELRRMLMLTPRNPQDAARQSFDPFRV